MEKWTGSKLGKEYIKAVYFHLAYLTYMQSTSCEMPSWMKHKLKSRLPGEISITFHMQMTPPLWQVHIFCLKMVTEALKLNDVCSFEEKL